LAVRIEFFTIAGTIDIELVPAATFDAAVAAFDGGDDAATPAAASGTAGSTPGAPVRCVGWLSASDDDEELMTDWAAEIDDELGLGLLRHGIGEAVGLAPWEVDAGDGDQAALWNTTLRGAVGAAAGGRFGWRTAFDQAGTSGTPDDFPTASRSVTP
jgi:hypothetical protein